MVPGRVRSERVQRWDESDTWDINNVVPVQHDIPQDSTYLESTDGQWLDNQGGSVECQSNPCHLQVTDTFSQVSTFTGERTKYTDEDAFDGVNGVTDPGGF